MEEVCYEENCSDFCIDVDAVGLLTSRCVEHSLFIGYSDAIAIRDEYSLHSG